MRISIEKLTKKIIEMQSGGEVEVTLKDAESALIKENEIDVKNGLSPYEITEDAIAGKYQILREWADNIEDERLNTLKQNALNAGYLEEDIEVKFVTDEEYQAILEANKPIPTYQELRKPEYPPTSDLIVALWEKVVENRPEEADKLQLKREDIKIKYPKE